MLRILCVVNDQHKIRLMVRHLRTELHRAKAISATMASSSAESFSTASGQPFVIDSEVERSVNFSEDGDCLPIRTPARFIKDIKEFEVRPTDIFVITWPRSGTTWTHYMINQIVNGPASVRQHNFLKKNFYLEAALDMLNLDETDGWYKLLKDAPDPRLLKSHLQMKHLPSQLFTKRLKIIYVARNPKDATVSYYNFTLMNHFLPNYKDWADFYDHSIRGVVPYGDWFTHVLSWWKFRNEPNVLFLKYEDSKKDIKGTVEKLSEFLEKPLSPEEVEEISRQSTFSEMAKNRKANPDLMNITHFDKSTKQKFMRKGTIGDWRNYYTPVQNSHFDALYREKMKGSGLTFDFEQISSVL